MCVAYEAIICSEREELYNAMIQFVLKNSKRRTNENIHVIAADGFINHNCVTNKFGLPNATYTCDTWHLFTHPTSLVKKGTKGCHGSSISESNHSSVLVHLNEGDKFGNSYCEKPHAVL